MKLALTFIAGATLATSLLAQSATPGAVTLPKYQQIQLPNGLTILLMEKRDVPLIAFHGRIRGGAIADPAGKEGTSDIVAELLTKGAGNRNAQQFAEAIDSVGGALGTSAGREALTMSGEFMAKDRALMLELISDMVRKPLLPKDEFAKVQKRAIESIAAAKDSDPRGLVPLYFNAFLFASHPYGRAASESSLPKITHDDVTSYVRDHFGADRAIFAFVGDFDSKSFANDVRKAFSGWKKAAVAAPKLAAFPPATGRRVLLVDKPDATQTYFYIGNVGIARNDPDRVVVDLANTAFGGRFTSMLNTELRVKSGLTYGAGSRVVRESVPGTVAISSFTKTETTEKAIDMALDILGRLRQQGLDDDTLQSVKTYVVGQFPPTLETSVALAAKLTELAFFGLDRSDVETYAANVMRADKPAISRVISRVYPDPKNLTFVLIGNAAQIRDVAKKYGEVTEIKITDPTFTPSR